MLLQARLSQLLTESLITAAPDSLATRQSVRPAQQLFQEFPAAGLAL